MVPVDHIGTINGPLPRRNPGGRTFVPVSRPWSKFLAGSPASDTLLTSAVVKIKRVRFHVPGVIRVTDLHCTYCRISIHLTVRASQESVSHGIAWPRDVGAGRVARSNLPRPCAQPPEAPSEASQLSFLGCSPLDLPLESDLAAAAERTTAGDAFISYLPSPSFEVAASDLPLACPLPLLLVLPAP